MVFVFGSNEKGLHGGGAARFAMTRGAIWGQAEGRQGDSYAIPTVVQPVRGDAAVLPLTRVQEYVNTFLAYAIAHPEEEFQVTRVGCGLAGFSDADIAPLFEGAPTNCKFDTTWQPYLTADATYWGTF